MCSSDLEHDLVQLIFITSDAQLLHFPATSVRPQGRAGGGMAGIKLSSGAQAVFFGSILGVGLIRYVLGADRRLTTWQPSTLGVVAVQYVLLVLVFAIGWGGGGRTFGKAILGLRVRRADGRPLGWGRALLRAGLCAAAPWILGFVALSRKNRGIHDVLLGTRVTYDWARGHV